MPENGAIGKTMLAYAIFIDTPLKFWVQLAERYNELINMMEALNKYWVSVIYWESWKRNGWVGEEDLVKKTDSG